MLPRLDTQTAILRFKQVHACKYSYEYFEYHGCERKSWIYCKYCKKYFQQSYKHHYLRRQGCPCCMRKRSKDTVISNMLETETVAYQYPNLAEEWHPDNCEYSHQKLPKSNTVIKWVCKYCGHQWSTSVSNRVNRNSGCPKCAAKYLSDLKSQPEPNNSLADRYPEYIKEWSTLNDKTPDQVFPHSHYNAHWICLTCNYSYYKKVKTRTLKEENCPNCFNRSKGENCIKNILNPMGLKYNREPSFKILIDRRKLRFDFQVFINNSYFLIEYQGIQHYNVDNFFPNKIKSPEKHLKLTKFRDLIKRDFCGINKIPLLVIPYTEYENIHSLIYNFIENNFNINNPYHKR